ncbi:hypothetical protein GALMADRAFT_148846, partial [Galerina marginata CBS 339.88]
MVRDSESQEGGKRGGRSSSLGKKQQRPWLDLVLTGDAAGPPEILLSALKTRGTALTSGIASLTRNPVVFAHSSALVLIVAIAPRTFSFVPHRHSRSFSLVLLTLGSSVPRRDHIVIFTISSTASFVVLSVTMSSSQSQPAPQEPATQEPAPPAPRRMLPQIWRHSIWRPDAGLIVSPTSRILPSEVVSQKGSTKLHDFSKPRLLDDDQPYLGFYPRRPLYRDKLFSCLAIDAPTLRESIKQQGDGKIPMFGLDGSLIRKWRGLEDPLLHFIFILHKNYPNPFPPIRFPRWPHEFGYDTTHQTADFAFICAKRSLAAFNMLAAVASFMISLWLTGYEDDCFD